MESLGRDEAIRAVALQEAVRSLRRFPGGTTSSVAGPTLDEIKARTDVFHIFLANGRWPSS